MRNPLGSKHELSWLSLGGITLLQSVSVTSSLYSAYSSLLGKQFSISKLQVLNLIVALETGKLFEWFPTAAADYLPRWTILLIGLLFGTVGYGVQYLHIVEKIHPLSYWQVFLLCLLAGNSICWIQTYCYFAGITNFKHHKNLASLTSCYAALSGKVYTSLVEGIQGRIAFPDPGIYLLLNCIVPALVGLVVVLIVSCSRHTECKETDVFSIAFAIAVATGVYAMLGNTVKPIKNMPPKLQVVTLTLVIMLPIAVPLVTVAHRLTIGRWRSRVMPELPTVLTTENCISIIKGDDSMKEVGEDGKKAAVKDDEAMGKVGKVQLGDEHGVKNLMMSLDFWLFFWVNACGPMLGLLYVNNLRRISESHGNHEVSSLLAVFSTSGFFGRIFLVLLEECTRYEHFLIVSKKRSQ